MVEKVDALVSGVSNNHKYKVVENSLGHFCGYVKTNFSSTWSYEDLRGNMNTLIEVHGGLTYGVDEHGWIGFDCAHIGDVCITDEIKKEYKSKEADVWTYEGVGSALNENRKVWTPEDVEEECESLAQQVNALENFAEKFSSRGW